MVQPRPRLGYVMVAVAATLFAVNGTVSKVILGSGISSEQLAAVRCTGALIGLASIAAATRPRSLRVRTGDVPVLIALGIALAVVQSGDVIPHPDETKIAGSAKERLVRLARPALHARFIARCGQKARAFAAPHFE